MGLLEYHSKDPTGLQTIRVHTVIYEHSFAFDFIYLAPILERLTCHERAVWNNINITFRILQYYK